MRKNLRKDKDAEKEKVPFTYSFIDAFKTNSNIEIIDNTLAIVEGSKGVLEYSDKIIRIALNGFSVAFLGRRLNLKCISVTSLEVEGFFTNIEFSM